MIVKPNMTVLFQGDSITDAGRDREDPAGLGMGYPLYVASLFEAAYPAYNVTFLNRGISGNRSRDLLARWTEDCIDLKPDVLSILIGINDTWRRYDENSPTSCEAYYDNYKTILSRTRQELGNIPILMLEPFLLPFIPDKSNWREDLDPKIHAARALAKEFDCLYIPLDGIFTANSMQAEPTIWSADGVHPTRAGHALIAKLWLKAVGA